MGRQFNSSHLSSKNRKRNFSSGNRIGEHAAIIRSRCADDVDLARPDTAIHPLLARFDYLHLRIRSLSRIIFVGGRCILLGRF